MHRKNDQRGFTLVEIAIVMVIIGLLLGGALKGQEMIENARVKRVKADFDQYVAAFYSYQDSYRALPGDNTRANAQHGATNAPNADGNDATIDHDWNSTTDDNESRLFWEHLRSAGFIVGAADDQDQPANSFGGIVGVQNAVAGFTGLGICFSNIDAEIAARLEAAYDDDVGTTGIIRGVTTAEAAVAYDDGTYAEVLCFEV